MRSHTPHAKREIFIWGRIGLGQGRVCVQWPHSFIQQWGQYLLLFLVARHSLGYYRCDIPFIFQQPPVCGVHAPGAACASGRSVCINISSYFVGLAPIQLQLTHYHTSLYSSSSSYSFRFRRYAAITAVLTSCGRASFCA